MKVKHHKFGFLPAYNVFQGLLRSGTYSSAGWDYVIKKEVIDRFNLKYSLRAHEDHQFSLEAFMRCRTAFVSRNIYYRQRVRSGSLFLIDLLKTCFTGPTAFRQPGNRWG